ncbi:hypothetical protein BHE74_00057737 [Ensete ventricosum]|nr:hypothetical protein BHE74_00057737 [Ensete ventricosum]
MPHSPRWRGGEDDSRVQSMNNVVVPVLHQPEAVLLLVYEFGRSSCLSRINSAHRAMDICYGLYCHYDGC